MKRLLLLFSMVACWISMTAQQQYTFTTAGATGQFGPTQADITSAYSGTSLAGQVTVNSGSAGGIQYWVVPQSGYYSIEAFGAQGYGSFGGRGAQMTGEFILTAGDSLKILVGQKSPPPVGSTNQYGGGGGSFVTYSDNTPLIVAGGGGGSRATAFSATADASITTTGNSGSGTNSGAGGANGQGGATASSSDGGGGLLGDGGGIGGGKAFVNGGAGGKGLTAGHAEGGFGGGGGTSSWDNYRTAGGGGYSGGGAGGENGQTGTPNGGGGGSFNSGLNQVNTAGVQLGDGMVIITNISSCPTPTNLNINVIACDSLILEWTNAADSGIVWLETTGTPPTTPILIMDDSTHTITGTAPNTSYDFYVANICGSDTSILAGPFTVNTGTIGAPVIDFTAFSAAFNLTVEFDATATTGASATYDWDFGDGTTGSGILTSHTYSTGGNYVVTLTVTNNCGTNDTTFTLSNIGLDENLLAHSLMLFPNPATSEVKVNFETPGTGESIIRIRDLSGKEIMMAQPEQINGKVEHTLNIGRLADGVYMLEISNGTLTTNKRLIKQ